MHKQNYTIIALTILMAIAGVLMFLLFSGGQPDMSFLPVIAVAVGLVVITIGVVLYFRKPTAQAGQPAKPAKYAIGMTILGAVIAQMGGILPQMLNGDHTEGSTPWVIVAAIFAAIGGVFAAVSPKKAWRVSAASAVHIPWVFALIIGMLILGVVSIVMGLVIGSQAGAQSSDIAWLLVALAVMLLVSVLVFRLIIVGTRSSAYALPDVLPAAGPPTDPHFARGGYYDGTKLLNQRVWGIPVPVMGRGYFMRGQGKAWLADEVLAFHLYLTRNPLVIPYGIIHGVKTKNLILVKNRLPGPGMSIIWGRPDMPMVTTIQVTQNKAENEAWAQEIMRRAGVWKDKMAVTQAQQVQ